MREERVRMGKIFTHPNQAPRAANNLKSPPPKPSLFFHKKYSLLTDHRIENPNMAPKHESLKSKDKKPMKDPKRPMTSKFKVSTSGRRK